MAAPEVERDFAVATKEQVDKQESSQDVLDLKTNQKVSLFSKKEILTMFQWSMPEPQNNSNSTDTERTHTPTKSFAVGSLFGSIKKRNSSGSKNGSSSNEQHPLVQLDQLLCKLTETMFDVAKKAGVDGADNDNQVASAEA